MKKIYTLALSLAMMAAATVSASAEGIHVGYCEGYLPAEGMGQSGSNAEIVGAVRITPEMLAPYATCQVTSLYVGLTKGASAYPEEVTGWLRADKDGEDIAAATVAGEGGWLTFTFDAPVNIADYLESGIWAGYTFVQAKKYNILGIGGETNIEDACWVAKNGKWSNFNKYGVLPVELIVEGEGLPQYDLALTSYKMSEVAKLGDELTIKGSIKNKALQTAVNPVIKVSYDNYEYTKELDVTLAYRENANFEITIPLDEEGERSVDVTVEVLWNGEQADDYAVDNAGTATVSLVKEVYFRKMVVEEATGGWCGFCVRGLVGLKEMRENYGNQFLGIGVHNGDDYVVDAYDKWIGSQISGYPSCVINRDGKVYDPNFQELEAYLSNMNPIATVGVDVEAKYDDQLHVTATLNSLADLDVDYRLALVVLEDQLPINQSNYYSGGGYGPMGGFEDLPSHCDILIDDVARAIYPAPAGAEGSVPAQLVKGQPYSYTFDVDMCQYANADNVSVVVMLIDAKTKQIVNGEKTAQIYGFNATPTGIQKVEEAAKVAAFNLNGQQVAAPEAGLNIVNGQVIFLAK